MPAPLTPLGQRTLDGFIKRYGPREGPVKFQAALDGGLIDRAKMENVGLAATPDAEDAAEAPETPGETPDAEDLAEGPESETMMAGPPALKRRRPPTGASVGRSAPGRFQKRPG